MIDRRRVPENDGLLRFNRSQKFLDLSARGKTADLAIVGIVFGCIGRAKHDKFASNGLDNYRQIVAVNGRGVPRAAMWTIVVAHARPIIGPVPATAIAGVVVEKPGHESLLGSQTIITTRHEIDKSAIAQILELLAYLGLDVLVAGIEIAQMPLERVDLVEREVAFAE
jgi:hypothetical protein